jgi:hypothetical protein
MRPSAVCLSRRWLDAVDFPDTARRGGEGLGSSCAAGSRNAPKTGSPSSSTGLASGGRRLGGARVHPAHRREPHPHSSAPTQRTPAGWGVNDREDEMYAARCRAATAGRRICGCWMLRAGPGIRRTTMAVAPRRPRQLCPHLAEPLASCLASRRLECGRMSGELRNTGIGSKQATATRPTVGREHGSPVGRVTYRYQHRPR